jgi:hypothetical protein
MSKIAVEFQKMVESYTPVNVANFIEFLRHQDVNDILENSHLIFSEPTRGATFMSEVYVTESIQFEELQAQHQKLDTYIHRKVTEGYDNQDHISALNQISDDLWKEMSTRSNTNALKESTIANLQKQKEVLLEQAITHLFEEPDVVQESWKTFKQHYQNAKDYKSSLTFKEKVISIALGEIVNYITIQDTTKKVNGESFNDKLTKPVKQIRSMVKAAKTTQEIESTIKEIDKAIATLRKNEDKWAKDIAVKNFIDGSKTRRLHIRQTITALEGIQDKLRKKAEKLKKKEAIHENVMTMEPVVGADEDMDVINPSDPWENSYCDHIEKILCEYEFGEKLVECFMDESEDIQLETLHELMRISHQYDILVEKLGPVNNALRKAARVGDKATHAMTIAARKSADNAKRVTVVAKKIPGNIDALINNTFGKLKDMDQAERRNKILAGGFKVKIYRLLKLATTTGLATLVHPALGALAFLTSIATDAKLDNDARKRILNELENELQLVNEKIEDARGAGDKQKKYQLMRIKQRLEGDLRRIQYRMSV